MSIHFLKRKFIPSHNADLDAIQELNAVSFEIAGPYAMEILEWIQDPNWAVAAPIIDYFQPYVLKLEEEFLSILNSTEEVWKKVILETFLVNLDKENIPTTIQTKLQQIAYSPSLSEIEQQVDQIAQSMLEEIDLKQTNSIRFEIKLSGATEKEIWNELKQSFPFLEQLSPKIGQIQYSQGLEQASHYKFQLIKQLSSLQKKHPQSIQGFLSRYHYNKPKED